MKKVIFLLIALVSFGSAIAQETSSNKISISAVQPQYPDIPEEARANLETKMQRMISANGLTSSAADRFILTARVDVTTREINTKGLIIQKMEITFFVGDVIEEKIYANTTVGVTGAGETDTKAMIKAFQMLKPSNPQFQEMLEVAKRGIAEYYTSNCSKIIQDAERMNGMQQYGEAIALLVSVPDVCEECYAICQQKAVTIYTQQINTECKKLIQQAKAAWNVKQDYAGAEEALDIIAKIDPHSSCADEANLFMQTISDKLRKEEREKAAAEAAAAKARWEFKVKQYEDKYALEVQKQADRAAILNTFANRFGRIDIGIKKEKAFKFGSSSK